METIKQNRNGLIPLETNLRHSTHQANVLPGLMCLSTSGNYTHVEILPAELMWRK